MSMRTRIRGMTAWVNLRLNPYNELMSNVLMDLLSGTGMKYLIESITGRDIGKLDSMNGLSQQQLQTRVEWVVEELKQCEVLPHDVYVDPRLFAMRSADHVFDLLWRLISHDAWFMWERVEYLQQEDQDVITQVPFKWTPDPPPNKKKKNKPNKSLLSGFGASAVMEDHNESSTPDRDWVKFPKSEFMKDFKKKKLDPVKFPPPDVCILEMVNTQLQKTSEGQNVFCYSLGDLVDSRVLCALVNSFVPNTFTTELLLNDRWTINLALRSAEKMFYAETPFNSEDLVEADGMAVASYFTFFFMVAYKYRQCQIVVERIEWIRCLIRECDHELEKYPSIVSNMQELQQRKELKSHIAKHKEDIERLVRRFDVEYCQCWVNHVQDTQLEVRKYIRDCIKHRFDCVTIPRNISINDLCLSYAINLSLSNGSGFYLSNSREVLTEGRRLVLKHRETGEFIDDFTSKNKPSIKRVLGLPEAHTVEINPTHFPQYEFYFEALSRNKHLKAGSVFLYLVFPGNTANWQHMFIKAARENEMEIVDKMITFFKNTPSFLNSKDPKTGYTALHYAARQGHFDIVRLLLESGADVDAQNNIKCTPIYSAIEGSHRQLAHLFIEWGCDMHCRNAKGLTPFEAVKNNELSKFLIDLYRRYADIVPEIMKGDRDLMRTVLQENISGKRPLCCLRSRCINGSTLLHTASYYSYHDILKHLLQLKVDVNLQDYKGATPLHRAKDHETLQILLDNGANIGAADSEGNTCLHVKCYGEINKPTEIESIELLLIREASPIIRNHRNLLPIHCCAMQGRIDAIQLLLKYDKEDSVLQSLNNESDRSPPSLLHLALANNCVSCAEWMIKKGFHFKDKEQDILLRRILIEQIKVTEKDDAVKLLLQNGADPNPIYPGGNSALHYAASISGETDVLELLISFGSEMNVLNDEGSSALMFACQANNQFSTCVLIRAGANVRQKNIHGLTAFDQIVDFDEWIQSGYFTEEITARLKAYSLKHSRDLIRAITKRVKSVALPRDAVRSVPQPSSPARWSRSPHLVQAIHSLTRPCSVLPAIGHSG